MAKKTDASLTFGVGQSVVYPAHGVGKITGVEKQTVAGMELEVYVVAFDQDKMRLRVPTGKCETVGMRKLSDKSMADDAMKVLTGKAREAHHVVAPRPGIRSEDQLRRPDCRGRSGARPVPLRSSA
jgi:RNA polymerase-interacting CarD/CdnL/TRCF family regulator